MIPRLNPASLVAAALAALLLASPLAWGQKPAPPPRAPIQFQDVTRAAGIDFHLTCGGPEKRYIMESLCGGVAFLDFDNDGWLDLFLVNGSTVADLHHGAQPNFKLYRNTRDGRFADVTAKAGFTRGCWAFGVAVGDYDNDGFDDLYVTCLDGGLLYHNNRDGTFTEVTAKAGVDNGGRWGTSAAFGDYDDDGFLDLYVANYVELDLDHLPEFGSSVFCQYRGIPVSCGPRGLKGSRDRLYRNNGDGAFTDVSEKLGIDPDANYGLGVLWGDFDLDGKLDLYVADDSTPSLLYHNEGSGKLTETGVAAGVAYSADGREQAGMGVDFADYDNDGLPDLAKTNFSDDSNNLYHNDGKGSFTDLGGPTGFGPVSIPFLGFGLKFADFDNDGWQDAFIANGHVNPQIDADGHAFGVTYAERPLLFHNLANGKFEEVGQNGGAALKLRKVGRGLAAGDFDNDGNVDLLVSNLDGSPALLRNLGARRGEAGHWLRIKTVGTRSNRDGFGARVLVTAGSLTQTSEVRANSSYLSASDPRLHFGLGSASRVDRIVVHWPSGATDLLQNETADQELVVEEGKGAVRRSAPAPSRPVAHPRRNPRPGRP
ncbi:MAG: CRTAC1 family protein [Terriglobales bacterium]